ncbi:hypothetical protein BMETH_171_0 [methanotrophic bacterial endosymbiont of Bathymodiolus sp.]|nr:hypothetical protein BMETH_171_0 [methanotrophic bacterial endosymbiont of Bathymodiolus sp.]
MSKVDGLYLTLRSIAIYPTPLHELLIDHIALQLSDFYVAFFARYYKYAWAGL